MVYKIIQPKNEFIHNKEVAGAKKEEIEMLNKTFELYEKKIKNHNIPGHVIKSINFEMVTRFGIRMLKKTNTYSSTNGHFIKSERYFSNFNIISDKIKTDVVKKIKKEKSFCYLHFRYNYKKKHIEEEYVIIGKHFEFSGIFRVPKETYQEVIKDILIMERLK